MAGKKRIQKYEKFGLQLTRVERKLILDSSAAHPNEFTQVIESTPARQSIMMTLDGWRGLVQHIASEANGAEDKKLQMKLDAIVLKTKDCSILTLPMLLPRSWRSSSHSQTSRSNSPNGMRGC